MFYARACETIRSSESFTKFSRLAFEFVVDTTTIGKCEWVKRRNLAVRQEITSLQTEVFKLREVHMLLENEQIAASSHPAPIWHPSHSSCCPVPVTRDCSYFPFNPEKGPFCSNCAQKLTISTGKDPNILCFFMYSSS